MGNITTQKYDLAQLPAALEQIFDEFAHASYEARQNAVQAGAEVFKNAVESATPKDTGEMAQSWVIQTKYKNVRYVGNTRVAKGKVYRKKNGGSKGEARDGVPLSNVLEYGSNSKHYGFIRRTFDAAEPQIFTAIKKSIENGGN